MTSTRYLKIFFKEAGPGNGERRTKSPNLISDQGSNESSELIIA